MKIYRKTKETLTVLEIDHEDILSFELADGKIVEISLVDSGAEIMSTTLKEIGVEEAYSVTTYRFWANFVINGKKHQLVREVGTQKSFYDPWLIDGAHIWLDAVDAIFEFMNETHGICRTQAICEHNLPERHHVRLAIQDAAKRICPEKIHPWCPLPKEGIKIENCYTGEDCWLGAYHGASAHSGLDINHPNGTPLYAPINLDTHFLYNRTEDGTTNNRWKGIRRWDDVTTWVLFSMHMNHLTVEEKTKLKAGQEYASAAGVWVGLHEHSHFEFAVFEYGELIRLDPWILFWQMYQDQKNENTAINKNAKNV